VSTRDDRVLTAGQQALLERCLSDIDGRIPLGRAECERAIHAAWKRGSLDFRALLSRFLWLVEPARPGREGIGLLEQSPRVTAEDLADALVHPRAAVLDGLSRRTGLDRGFLTAIYESIECKGAPGDVRQVADLTEERILQDMKWWLADLRFPAYYLKNTPAELMARQIMLNRFYELPGRESEAYSQMKVSSISPDGSSLHWVHRRRSLEVEEEIEREYYAGGKLLNVAAYAPLPNLLLYVVYRGPDTPSGATIQETAPESFLRLTEAAALRRYESVLAQVRLTGRIVIERTRKEETSEHRVMIGFRRGTINHFQANISRVMARHGIEPSRTYTVTFGGTDPVIVATLYSPAPFPSDLLRELVEVSLYPPGSIGAQVEGGKLTPAEANFVNAAVPFVHQFISVPDPDIGLLSERFRGDRELAAILSSIQARVDRDTFTLAAIEQVYRDRPDIVHELFRLFRARLDPVDRDPDAEHAVRARMNELLSVATLTAEESEVVRCSVRFVDAVLRTNFFLEVKAALSFRLAPGFPSRGPAESTPFAVFYVVGRDFHGFHVRFKDIARGGIRLLHTASWDEYRRAEDSLYEECHALAFTQNKKNKDIPEGGSKGIILPAFGTSRRDGEQAFRSYVDAMLDLMVPDSAGAIAGGQEEILFFGPDEGTADLMDWACLRARERGYRWWKALTTGKAAAHGGISHKEYGMTTEGVHRYVLGVLRELGIAEQTITKFQTGGPDGDLGSNEILVSADRTIGVVDGGGVLYDPDGLDRVELARLARAGQDCSAFDRTRLGPRGFLVVVKDREVSLPDGTRVASGLGFRNTFHLDPRVKADLFVPCGGRPKSVNLSNWRSLLDADGRPLFRWIVEGANLFITQEARLKLEEKGVVLFKDSSTNKGGVISSSFEVLAGLALSDEEHGQLMAMPPGAPIPAFRERYIEEVITAVRRKADQEFGLLWKTHAARGTPLSELSEAVSRRINEITASIEGSDLYGQESIRRNALRKHVPPSLVSRVGLESLMERLPESYQKAIVARTIASAFVYECGLEAGFEDYRQFVEEFAAWREAAVRSEE
jgi:glutamate dehydrogenase